MGFFISIFLSTFVLEDVALITGLALIDEQKISFMAVFVACFLGIAIGDLGLYFIGMLISKYGVGKHLSFFKKYHQVLSRMRGSDVLTYSIVISRLIPGTRLPTYLGAGFVRYSFWRFFLLTISSVFAWVLLALVGGRSIQHIFMNHVGWSLVTFIIVLSLFKSLIPKLSERWERAALWHSWRKWTTFEFWPAWFFYIPIIPYYLFLSLKHRSVFTPFYANPTLVNGGLIGESKWDFLKFLDRSEASTLKSFKMKKESDFMDVLETLETEQIDYPFIMKPDIGQRGFGVRIIRNDFDLTEYLLLSDFDIIIQSLSKLPCEAGLFYIRRPSELMGQIFSITDKTFPFVTGDGVNSLGALILKDKRARIMAATYFKRLKDELDSVPELNKIIFLSECGNHCQGAIFHNGHKLITSALTLELDRLAKKIPDFYFGRFDVRYSNHESLKKGLEFEIVEVNGAGSEATHIWDANTKLSEAYQTLFKQWNYLFEIGAEVKKGSKKSNIKKLFFITECLTVFFRKGEFTTSS